MWKNNLSVEWTEVWLDPLIIKQSQTLCLCRILLIEIKKGWTKTSKLFVSSTKRRKKVEKSKPLKRASHIKCLKCLGLGHIALKCPNKRVMAIWETKGEVESEDETTIEENEDNYKQENIVEYVNKGELLVVCQALTSLVKMLHKNIFHRRCTNKKKVCRVIIDGGSCINITSTPHPYRLQWLNDNKDVRVGAFYDRKII